MEENIWLYGEKAIRRFLGNVSRGKYYRLINRGLPVIMINKRVSMYPLAYDLWKLDQAKTSTKQVQS